MYTSCFSAIHYGNGISQLLRASILEYIAKLNYATLNNARHYEINDEKPALAHLR